MPRIEATRVVPVPIEVAFAVSQSHGAVRLRWDPFIHDQRLMNAVRPDTGVRTQTTSRHRLRMVSEYTSFRPPHRVGMKMVRGPWFLGAFGGGWTFTTDGPSDRPTTMATVTTVATWRYTFTVRPHWLRPIGNPVGSWLLRRDIEARISAFASACLDPGVVVDALAQARH